jgi:uncharacterized protein DUF2505
MKIERVMQLDIPAADVFEMASSKDYQERKCADAGALSWDVHVETTDDGAVVRTKRKLPTVGFPSLVRKFVPSGVTSTETVTWGALAEDGTRTAALHVNFHGAPARMNGTIRIVPTSDSGSEVHVDADFTALVPIVARKVEQLAAPIVVGVIDSEEKTGQAWAAGER